jgi:hypothetical protein
MLMRDAPSDAVECRRLLYDGRVLLLPPTGASSGLVDAVLELLSHELGSDDVRAAPLRMDNHELFRRIGRVRKIIYLEPEYHAHIRAVLAGHGFDPDRIAFDPLRLRVVSHQGHENPLAQPVYYPHRDTWYGHSQALITWWIPLHDLAQEETFVFFPDRFAEAVPNDSEVFDYDEWVKNGWSLKIGWQDMEAGKRARYPSVIGEPDRGRAVGFSTRRGDNLLFSGAQFHQTLPQALGRTRYSIDFRAVHLGDHASGFGAPNVDNRSRGSALVDYIKP